MGSAARPRGWWPRWDGADARRNGDVGAGLVVPWRSVRRAVIARSRAASAEDPDAGRNHDQEADDVNPAARRQLPLGDQCPYRKTGKEGHSQNGDCQTAEPDPAFDAGRVLRGLGRHERRVAHPARPAEGSRRNLHPQPDPDHGRLELRGAAVPTGGRDSRWIMDFPGSGHDPRLRSRIRSVARSARREPLRSTIRSTR